MKLRRCVVLGIMLSQLVSATAFAASGTREGERGEVSVSLTKNLCMSSRATTPVKSFSYSFEGVDMGLVLGEESADDIPVIEDVIIDINAADDVCYGDNLLSEFVDSPDNDHMIKVVTDSSSNILDGITFPHAGVYSYIVKEKSEEDGSIIYSKASYLLEVYVANTATGDVEVTGTTVIRILDDNGDAVEGEKVDITEGTGETGFGNEFAFRNDYVVNGQLAISKAVEGLYGDLTKDFNFVLTIDNPVFGGTGTYTADILEDGVATGETLSFATGENIFTLHDGQSINVKDLPVGTTYQLLEKKSSNYTPRASIKSGEYDNVFMGENNPAGFLVNHSLTDDDGVRLDVIDENGNGVSVTNTYREITMTGIVFNNITYGVVLLCSLFLGVLIFMRRRDL